MMNPVFLILMLASLSLVGAEIMNPLFLGAGTTNTGIDPWHLFWFWVLSVFSTGLFSYSLGRSDV
jgi:hypothetical protein